MASAASNILNLLTGGSGKVKERKDFEQATVDPATGEIVGGRDRFTQSKIGSFLSRLSGDDTARSKNIEQNDLLQQMQLESMLRRSNQIQGQGEARNVAETFRSNNRQDDALALFEGRKDTALGVKTAEDVVNQNFINSEASLNANVGRDLATTQQVPLSLLDSLTPYLGEAAVRRLQAEASSSVLKNEGNRGAIPKERRRAGIESDTNASSNLVRQLTNQGLARNINRSVPTKGGNFPLSALIGASERGGAGILPTQTEGDIALRDAQTQAYLSRASGGVDPVDKINLERDKRNRDLFAKLEEGGEIVGDDGRRYRMNNGVIYEMTLNGWVSIEEGE